MVAEIWFDKVCGFFILDRKRERSQTSRNISCQTLIYAGVCERELQSDSLGHKRHSNIQIGLHVPTCPYTPSSQSALTLSASSVKSTRRHPINKCPDTGTCGGTFPVTSNVLCDACLIAVTYDIHRDSTFSRILVVIVSNWNDFFLHWKTWCFRIQRLRIGICEDLYFWTYTYFVKQNKSRCELFLKYNVLLILFLSSAPLLAILTIYPFEKIHSLSLYYVYGKFSPVFKSCVQICDNMKAITKTRNAIRINNCENLLYFKSCVQICDLMIFELVISWSFRSHVDGRPGDVFPGWLNKQIHEKGIISPVQCTKGCTKSNWKLSYVKPSSSMGTDIYIYYLPHVSTLN